jgi:hypothetical protein
MANFFQMAQKAQQFKGRMQELQERVGQADVHGESAGGLVTCRLSGRFVLKKLTVDAIIRAGDPEVMEDLIIAAVNDAHARAEQLMADETKKLMEDLGLPPGLGLPF